MLVLQSDFSTRRMSHSKFSKEEQVDLHLAREEEQNKRIRAELEIPVGVNLEASPLELARQLYVKEFQVRKDQVSAS